MMKRLQTKTFGNESRSRICPRSQKGQSFSGLTFQADLLAAKVEQSGVVSWVGRGHVQLQQNLNFRTLLTRAEKSNAET